MPDFMNRMKRSWKSFFNGTDNKVNEDIKQNRNEDHCVGGKILHNKRDDSKPPCAVIVTIKSGSSFDDLFTSTPQVSPDETVAVKVFYFNYAAIPDILRCIRNESCRDANSEVAEIIQEMLHCRRQVDADSFVINFECCSGCSCQGFAPSAAGPVQQLLAWMIREKHTTMFADYSLKSLIADWSSSVLGPNPFVNLGVTDQTLELQFNPEKLLESPNTQLQNLGRMCNKGKAYINVLPSTIVFTVNPSKAKTSKYELEILSIVNPSGDNVELNAKGTTGTVGHAILRYASGACILVSAGHWIELTHLDGIDEDALISTTERTMGLTEANSLRCELSSARTSSIKQEVMQRQAKRTLLSTVPCTYSSSETS